MWPRPLRGAWTAPQAAAAALLPAENRVAICSGNGLGKTHLLGDIVASFVAEFADAQVLITAPTRHQVTNLLWPAIWSGLRAVGLADDDDWGGVWVSGARSIRAVATNRPERLQGFHAPHLLIVCDEASGLRVDLLAALQGCAVASSNWIVLLGNPNSDQGALWSAMHSPTYATTTIRALDHPNVTERRDVIPGAVTWASILEMIRDWCRELPGPDPEAVQIDVTPDEIAPLPGASGPRWWLPNDEFRVRVLGAWPRQPGSTLFAAADVQACTLAPLPPTLDDHHAAADIARLGGDATYYAERRGSVVTDLRRIPPGTIPETAQALQALLMDRRPESITIDAAGLGVGVVDLLRASSPCPVRAFIGADAPISPAEAARYTNRRAVAFARLATLVARRTISLPNDPDLAAELALITVEHDDKHRLQLLSKAVLRAKLGRSTDRADSLSMLFDVGVPGLHLPPPPRSARQRGSRAW